MTLFFIRYNLAESTQSGFKGTKKFNIFMQRWSQEKGVQEMLDKSHHIIQSEAGPEHFEDPFLDVNQEFPSENFH